MTRLMVLSFCILPLAGAWAQSFECVASPTGGVTMFGQNNTALPLSCTVTCTYWKPDGSEGYQRYTVQMPPNMPRRQICGFNVNDARTIIGVGHSC